MDSLEKPVNGSSLMSLRGLGIGFGKRKLLCDVDTSFVASSLTALLGRNGSGKSTLLRAMAGLGRYDGSISVAGHDIAMLSAARRRVCIPSLSARTSSGLSPWTLFQY